MSPHEAFFSQAPTSESNNHREQRLERKFKRKSLEQVEVEADAEYGKEQFQKLAKRGIRIPIALL
jgi:hypothetical protein